MLSDLTVPTEVGKYLTTVLSSTAVTNLCNVTRKLDKYFE